MGKRIKTRVRNRRQPKKPKRRRRSRTSNRRELSREAVLTYNGFDVEEGQETEIQIKTAIEVV